MILKITFKKIKIGQKIIWSNYKIDLKYKLNFYFKIFLYSSIISDYDKYYHLKLYLLIKN